MRGASGAWHRTLFEQSCAFDYNGGNTRRNFPYYLIVKSYIIMNSLAKSFILNKLLLNMFIIFHFIIHLN